MRARGGVLAKTNVPWGDGEQRRREGSKLGNFECPTCVTPDGCCMTAYDTAHVPSKLASPNTWMPIRFKDSFLRLMLPGTFTFVGSFVTHFSHFLTIQSGSSSSHESLASHISQ